MSGAEYGTRDFWTGESGDRRAFVASLHIPDPAKKGLKAGRQATSICTEAVDLITGSYDPELDLVYWGTGNAGPWNPTKRAGDNLYTASLLAIRPKTARSSGIISLHRTTCMTTMRRGNDSRRHAGWRTGAQGRDAIEPHGFLYVLDRTDRKAALAKPYEKVNWATSIDLETGRPVESDVSKKLLPAKQVELWPSTRAEKIGRSCVHPETGLLYANTQHMASLYRFVRSSRSRLGCAINLSKQNSAARNWRPRRACRRDRSDDRRAALARAMLTIRIGPPS